MFLASANKTKRLLHLSFIGHVRGDELADGEADVAALLAELPAGFRLLTDLGRLDAMDADCATAIARIMEACDRRGVEVVVRVVPDARKDIGFKILGLFHYQHHPRAVICESMEEAARLLSL